jgi:lantibiotic modifying enzyme
MALLELYGVTHEIAYKEGAEMAFRYERSWYDAAQGNWPDFRFRRPHRGSAKVDILAYSTFWCHGAPGIALSRLRAYALSPDPLYMEEAAAGLETTRKAVDHTLQANIHDFSLCHGLAGNCEVLLAGINAQSNPARYTLFRDAVLQAAAAGIEQFSPRNTPLEPQSRWPCGVGGGYTPSLMLGTSGIGLFYLHLFAPNIPSPLLITPSAQASPPQSA